VIGVAAASALSLLATAQWGCLGAGRPKPEVHGVERRTVDRGDGVVAATPSGDGETALESMLASRDAPRVDGPPSPLADAAEPPRPDRLSFPQADPVASTSDRATSSRSDLSLPPPGRRFTGARISLEFKGADISNVLRLIADVAHRSIVATDDVQGLVTIALFEVPWDEALDILLRSTGLEMIAYGDVIRISTAKRLEEERKARLAAANAAREIEPLQTAYFRVNYMKPADLARLLRGGDTVLAGAATAGITATPIADPSEGRAGLLSSRGIALVNEATSTLIVRDIGDGIESARELVRRLDVQTEQVAIQGLIFEADASLARDLGIRWGAEYRASPETGNPTGSSFPGRIGIGGAGPRRAGDGSGVTEGGEGAPRAPILIDLPAANVQPGSGSTLGLLLGSLDGTANLDAEITALEKAGKGKVISRPKVITLNNAEAQIQSLEILRVRLPSSGTVINTAPDGVAESQNVATQAIDTGIVLKVTPQVSADGYVLLQIFVKSSVPSSQSTDDIPNEISRQATSQVLVRDGETVVIGGVYRQRAITAETGVPWLRSVPVLGWLFKRTSRDDVRQELLVFITPKVVWRAPGRDLPSARELWDDRHRSAYELSATPPDRSAPAGTEVAP
jgi:type IV pilus assembly protein PilQ